MALVRYLADMRFKLSHWLNAEEPNAANDTNSDIRILFSPSLEAQDLQACVTEHELEEGAELVDTTLFRAYMFCRPQLVGPLVRRPNRCIPSIVQEMLEQAHVLPDKVFIFDDRNIATLPSFCWGRAFIAKHYNFCSL